MCLHVSDHVWSPKISAHMIGISGRLHLELLRSYTSDKELCNWLLGTKRAFNTGTH